MKLPIKDPADVLDYAWDWTAWLAAGETIASIQPTVPVGLTLDSSTFTDTVATVWLSGGTAGETYKFSCAITTNQGRTVERSLTVVVRER